MEITFRREHDFLGEREIPDDVYYGIQTLRARENFDITGIPASRAPLLIKAFGYVKKAAALANYECGVLDKVKTEAICFAADKLIAGEYRDQFVSDLIQGGAGTSCNMLREKCVDGITANADHAREMVMNSIGIVTQLNPILGYEVSAGIAKEALQTGKSVQEITVKERKLITQEKWDQIYSVENLISPKYIDR